MLHIDNTDLDRIKILNMIRVQHYFVELLLQNISRVIRMAAVLALAF